MPHQCVRCGTIYDDGSKEILSGCSCGAKLFFFIKKERLKEAKEETAKLSKREKEEIEKDVFDLVGSEIDEDKPVVLDFESIKVLKPGKYELDLVSLFKEEPLVYKLEDGKYMVDILATFKSIMEKKK
ncbi:hypothetical protein GF336_07690 [Candidatus Woesearchaeota archaeon]|nr:hypothetical protein [Candidatus Woesearchaeota archaeon]